MVMALYLGVGPSLPRVIACWEPKVARCLLLQTLGGQGPPVWLGRRLSKESHYSRPERTEGDRRIIHRLLKTGT